MGLGGPWALCPMILKGRRGWCETLTHSLFPIGFVEVLMGRQRRKQVTCWCGAYEFPHRLDSGNCTGCAWAQSYFWNEKIVCAYCNSNNNGSCDVADGREQIRYCDGVRETIHRQPNIRHPMRPEDFLSRQSWNQESEPTEPWRTDPDILPW